MDLCKKNQKLLSSLKDGFSPTVTLLLHPVLNVQVMRKDNIQLSLTSWECVQSTRCLANQINYLFLHL